jgi:hypothetical protein
VFMYLPPELKNNGIIVFLSQNKTTLS